ncbi:MAG: YhjD/YihY/BrkB family envelope integrity protein, partial [Myxococcota bacterium]
MASIADEMRSEPDAPGDGSSVPEVYLRCKACGRDATSPWGIPWAGWRDIAWRVGGELRRDHVTVIAAGVAFFGLLAFFPAMGALVATYGLFADPTDVAEHLAPLAEVLPRAGTRLILTSLERIAGKSNGSLGFSAFASVAVALWSTSRGMQTLLRALTIAYDEEANLRRWVEERATSMALTAMAVLLGASAIAVIVALPALLAALGVSGLVAWFRWPVFTTVSVLALSALYRFGPARRRPRWRWVVVGALVATLLWVIGSG